VWGRKREKQVGAKPLVLRTDDAWPAIVDSATFAAAQAGMAARAPGVIHPREVESPYLLSSLMRCGRCGAAMVGQGTGPYYRYYVCGNAHRKGREVCSSPVLRKDRVERFVIDRIKDYVLTKKNLEEVAELTNDELAQAGIGVRERLTLLEAQVAEVDSRLSKLYDVLETGQFERGDLSPRIRALVQRKEELQQAKNEAEEALQHCTMDMVDPVLVHDYVNELRDLLTRSSITEQKSFLKSFVEGIQVSDTEVKIRYTIPMPPQGLSEETTGLLPFIHHG
jgi:uncharacterized coiled-coil protein SlyX